MGRVAKAYAEPVHKGWEMWVKHLHRILFGIHVLEWSSSNEQQNGPFLKVENGYKRLWDLLIFTEDSSGVSQTALPLTHLTSFLKPFFGTTEVDHAFHKHKYFLHLLLFAPFQTSTDSTILRWTVLILVLVWSYHHHSEGNWSLHPCALFFGCLSPAKNNYDVSNWTIDI